MIVAHKQAGLGSNFFLSSSLGTTIAIPVMAAEEFSSVRGSGFVTGWI
jgi:hypothetical protein